MSFRKNVFVTTLIFFISIVSIVNAYAQAEALKLYLSFNQPKYVQGDTAFFSGRLLLVENLKPADGKKVVSLKLFGSDGKLRFHNPEIGCGTANSLMPGSVGKP